MTAQIPARNTSKYAGQYAGTLGSQRVAEIFVDSYRIALTSKHPYTARDRFALAVEAYHQFMSMQSSAEARTAVQQAMEELVELFPIRIIANEALGLREKAQKLKTPRKRLDLLRRASEIVHRGLIEHPLSAVLQAASEELRTEIAQSEAAM